jgi:short-subunit dehydrogenase
MKKALITGATGGLGQSLARLLRKRGYELFLTGRDRALLEQLGEELQAVTLPLDLGQSRAPLLERLRAEPFDLLINNAGFAHYGNPLDHPLADEQDVLTVNAAAVLDTTLTAAHAWRAAGRGGTIVNIASAASLYAFPGLAVYAAAKAFVVSLSRSLDLEFRPDNIRVLTSLPGLISTSFAARASRGNYRNRSLLSMHPDKAAALIWRQIERGTTVQVIDGRYRFLHALSHLLPTRVVAAFLHRCILARIR